MTSFEQKHPRATIGQFATKAQSDAEVDLGHGPNGSSNLNTPAGSAEMWAQAIGPDRINRHTAQSSVNFGPDLIYRIVNERQHDWEAIIENPAFATIDPQYQFLIWEEKMRFGEGFTGDQVMAMASDAETEPSDLEHLAWHGAWEVRKAVAERTDAPRSTRERLTKDVVSHVRSAAVENLLQEDNGDPEKPDRTR